MDIEHYWEGDTAPNPFCLPNMAEAFVGLDQRRIDFQQLPGQVGTNKVSLLLLCLQVFGPAAGMNLKNGGT
jgi:hypothetical protein